MGKKLPSIKFIDPKKANGYGEFFEGMFQTVNTEGKPLDYVPGQVISEDPATDNLTMKSIA